MGHIPVLLQEVITTFDPKPGEHFIDATIGEGGHARAILERTAPLGVLLGIDRDQSQIEIARKNLASFQKRLTLCQGSFGDIDALIDKKAKGRLQWSGILFDLGWGQWHVKKAGRGFSFLKNEPLDMRYDTSCGLTAADIIANRTQDYIENILFEYSQERFAKAIAGAIVRARKEKPIQSTFQLVDIMKSATPFWYHHRRIHPGTKTFQALRIAVNDEIRELRRALEKLPQIISKKGKTVIISFHSSEDKIVKHIFKDFYQNGLGEILTKKPIVPSFLEKKLNPPSRSAKLRGFQFNIL